MRKVPEPDFRPVKRRRRSGIDGAIRHQIAEQQLRRHIGSDGPRRHALARLQEHAHGLAVLDDQRRDRGVRADDGAARLGRARHGLRDGAHAADGVAPHPGFAVHLAEGVVQQHVGGAGREGAGVGADDAVEGQRALHHLALEPLRQVVRRALGEEVEQQPLVVEREADEAAAEARASDQLEDAAAGVGRPPAARGRAGTRPHAPAPRRRPAAAPHPSRRTRATARCRLASP